jgi:hypothetical protein
MQVDFNIRVRRVQSTQINGKNRNTYGFSRLTSNRQRRRALAAQLRVCTVLQKHLYVGDDAGTGGDDWSCCILYKDIK